MLRPFSMLRVQVCCVCICPQLCVRLSSYRVLCGELLLYPVVYT